MHSEWAMYVYIAIISGCPRFKIELEFMPQLIKWSSIRNCRRCHLCCDSIEVRMVCAPTRSKHLLAVTPERTTCYTIQWVQAIHTTMEVGSYTYHWPLDPCRHNERLPGTCSLWSRGVFINLSPLWPSLRHRVLINSHIARPKHVRSGWHNVPRLALQRSDWIELVSTKTYTTMHNGQSW